MMIELGQVADLLGAKCIGDKSLVIEGIAPLAAANGQEVSFLSNNRYIDQLTTTKAAAVILKPGLEKYCKGSVLIHDDPYLCFAKLSGVFSKAPVFEPGIEASAIVADSAVVADTAYIGKHVVIGEGVYIGENSIIEANSVVGDHCHMGNDCHLFANVTLYHKVILGDEVHIHSGSVIGSDGFGFAPAPGDRRKWHKIHQQGTVIVGSRVDIGSCTTIDRGALENTIIDNDVIIDSHVHIGHNCVVGEGSALAGCVGLAGSSTIGKFCSLAGGVGIAGHLEITDHVTITGMTMVTRSIQEPGSYSSGTPMMTTRDWRKAAVRFSQLESLNKRIKKLER